MFVTFATHTVNQSACDSHFGGIELTQKCREYHSWNETLVAVAYQYRDSTGSGPASLLLVGSQSAGWLAGWLGWWDRRACAAIACGIGRAGAASLAAAAAAAAAAAV